MQITEQESIKLSRYLIKGMNDSDKEKYSALEIGLNDTCAIGVLKKRKSLWKIYLKVGRKKYKKLNIEPLSQYPALPDVHPVLFQLINGSAILKDQTLDLSRIPELPLEPGEIPVQEEVVTGENYSFQEEKTDTKEETLSIKEHELNEEQTSKDSFEEVAISEKAEDINKNVMPAEEIFEDTGVTEVENNASDDKVLDVNKHQILEKEEADFMENNTEQKVNMNELKNFTIVPYGHLDIEKNSYIYMLMERYPERYINILKKMDALIYKHSLEDAATRFITDLNEVLRIYGYDADKVAEELNIDKRDIALCICENNML